MSDNIKHRLFGLLLIAMAMAFGWWGIYQPYQDALAGAAEVRVQNKVFVIAPMALVFGVFFTLFGDSVDYRNAEESKFTIAGYCLMGLALLAAIGGFFWLQAQFDALGYS